MSHLPHDRGQEFLLYFTRHTFLNDFALSINMHLSLALTLLLTELASDMFFASQLSTLRTFFQKYQTYLATE